MLGTLVASALTAQSVAAQSDAGASFECGASYQVAMQAMGSLTVTSQAEASGFEKLAFGPHVIVTFDPTETLVFGQEPESLTLKIFEPQKDDPQRRFKAQYTATFGQDVDADAGILAANSWTDDPSCVGFRFCAKSLGPGGENLLTYDRKVDKPFALVCEIKIRESELEG